GPFHPEPGFSHPNCSGTLARTHAKDAKARVRTLPEHRSPFDAASKGPDITNDSTKAFLSGRTCNLFNTHRAHRDRFGAEITEMRHCRSLRRGRPVRSRAQ